MKAQEIYNDLIRSSLKIWETDTCDGLIVGDPNKEVHRIATCFKLTMPLVQQALEQQIDMIITHEPTFSREDPCTVFKGLDEQRLKLLQESGLTVYRYHDHAHDREPDYIHAGFLDAVGLKVKRQFPLESFAVRRYELEEETTTHALALRVKERLQLGSVRLVDGEDRPVKTICLALGWLNTRCIRAFADMDSELFITGEMDEAFSQEYVRDAAFFGKNKSILLLGHYGAEFAGMRLLARDLNETVAPTVFLDGGEVYRYL
jgi:putative NIF3 family GTP cyclohydrolase 1 type 2